MAEITNREKKAGSLAGVIVGADVFIGVSAPGTLTTEEKLNEVYIIPKVFDPSLGAAVSKAVAEAARASGVARI